MSVLILDEAPSDLFDMHAFGAVLDFGVVVWRERLPGAGEENRGDRSSGYERDRESLRPAMGLAGRRRRSGPGCVHWTSRIEVGAAPAWVRQECRAAVALRTRGLRSTGRSAHSSISGLRTRGSERPKATGECDGFRLVPSVFTRPLVATRKRTTLYGKTASTADHIPSAPR
jgi:hypothetical protein